MKREADELQTEISKALDIGLDAIEDFEKRKLTLLNQFIALNEIKHEEEKAVNYYELTFIGFDGECYCPEISWTIKTDRNYYEMEDYVHNLNTHHHNKYTESKSYYIFKEIEVLDGVPSIGKLEHDLKEL